VLFLCAIVLPACAGEHFAFVQMCDPQFGFGGYKRDVLRFQQAVRQINELQPDFVVVCGDLVNIASIDGTMEDLAKEKSAFRMPCYCAPGNHDVGAVAPELLAQYRRVIGPDYFEFEHKGQVFLMVNSELWAVTVPEESPKHDAWFESCLKKASAEGKPIFVAAHRPLYVSSPDEPSDAWNIPLETRKRLLALMERHGVVAWLSGHIHRTVLNDYKGIQLVSSTTTSVNFDEQPLGFRIWHVGEVRPYRHESIPLDLSNICPGVRVTGTVSGLRPNEGCVVVVISGRHTPEHWSIEALQRLERQSYSVEVVKDGKLALEGPPKETVTVVVVAHTPGPKGLQVRFASIVLDPLQCGDKPLSFVFQPEQATSTAPAAGAE